MRARRGRAGAIWFAVVLAACARSAEAQTTRPTLSASIGFAGVHRLDNWSPVFVQLADADRRAGTLELRVARGRIGHDVVARVVANPAAQTFTLYAPVGTLDRAQLQFRDARGALLARRDLADAIAGTPSAFAGTSVGVAGEPASAQRVVNGLIRDTGEYVAAGAIETRLLPERAIGYRAIDVLVIAGLDTDAIDDRVERAIVDWVRAGGVLIAWPGAQRPTARSPLADVLPATFGEIETRAIDGVTRSVRKLDRVDAPGIAALDDGTGSTFRRRVGLGQIVLASVDPTTLEDVSTDERIARWRTLTENQFSLTADDRRRGVFDSLVAQSLAEQSFAKRAPTATDYHTVLWLALAAGLLLGPAEIAMLLAARQHPRTPFTLVGLALVAVSGVALLIVPTPLSSRAMVEVVVEAGERDVRVAMTSAADAARAPGATRWLAGDASDPTRQPAGAMRLAMRESAIESTPTWLAAGAARPTVREIEFGPAAAEASSADDAVAVVGPNDVCIGTTSSAATQAAAIAADDPGTRRVETGIERLARDPAWAGVLLDRTLASRLVRVQEAEGATFTIRRSQAGDRVRFTIDVDR